MTRKRRRRFQAAREVRALARERIGTPPPSRPHPDRRQKAEKHKRKSFEEGQE